MSVENWGRREAEQAIPAGRDREFMGDGVPHAERIRFADGIVHAFDALLSDAAILGAVASIRDVGPDSVKTTPAEDWEIAEARAALQAAIAAVTEGENDGH